MKRTLILLGVGVAITSVALVYMASASSVSTNLDDETRAVASTLKCPVCHDLSVADSPAPVAAQMRAEIRSKLQAGESPDQIRQDFVVAYGPSILLSPPARGINLSLWAAPILIALLSFVVALVFVRRWTRSALPLQDVPTALSARDAELLDRALAGMAPE